MTTTGFIQQKAPEDQPEVWGLETSTTRVLDEVRTTDQVVDAVGSTSKPLSYLAVNPALKLTEFDLLRIRFQYGIPESVELRLPMFFERLDWDIPSWTCFYELPFLQGLRFPVPLLSRQLQRFFNLAQGQLMPNG
ncbi:hypothetical protein ACOSQ4_018907 [Xanthoceras sorbifolium]